MANLTYTDAKKLITDEYASLKCVTCTEHVSVEARYVDNISKGIKEYLNSSINKYSKRHSGIVVAYGDIKVLQSHGFLLPEEPCVHILIQGEFVVFQPNIGDILKARVNQVGGDHIGCLVHDCFNASVPSDVAPGALLPKMGEEFLLRVNNVIYRNEVITINGEIRESLHKEDSDKQNVVIAATDEDLPLLTEPKRKKRKRKHATPEKELDSNKDNHECDTHKRKKRHKSDSLYHKIVTVHDSESDFVIPSTSQKLHVPQSDDWSNIHKKKKKKKREHQNSLSSDSGIVNDALHIDASEHSISKGKKKKHKSSKYKETSEFKQKLNMSLPLFDNEESSKLSNHVKNKHKKKKKHRESI